MPGIRILNLDLVENQLGSPVLHSESQLKSLVHSVIMWLSCADYRLVWQK